MAMASPATPPPHGRPTPAPLEPKAIRACLTPDVAAEFDREWDVVLDTARREQDLQPVQRLYLVLEDIQEVHVVMVQWLGPAG